MKDKIHDVFISSNKIVKAKGSHIYHGINDEDIGFNKFSEIYFSILKKNFSRDWKNHNKMTCNLLAISGEIKIVIFDNRNSSISKGLFQEILISRKNFKRVTIPPKLWINFIGLSDKDNILVNIANIRHDPKELYRKPFKEISYNWENHR